MSDNSNMSGGEGYSQMQGKAEQQDMGGGGGVHGSGIAGGYEGSQASSGTGSFGGMQQGGQSGEKQDWLDKGIEMAGKKAGFNIVSSNWCRL